MTMRKLTKKHNFQSFGPEYNLNQAYLIFIWFHSISLCWDIIEDFCSGLGFMYEVLLLLSVVPENGEEITWKFKYFYFHFFCL